MSCVALIMEWLLHLRSGKFQVLNLGNVSRMPLPLSGYLRHRFPSRAWEDVRCEQVIFTYAALTPGTPHGSVAWMPVVTLSVCHPKAPSRSVKRSALSGTRSLSFELLPLRKSMFTLMDNVLSSPKCSPGNHVAKQITKQWVLIFPIMLASVLCW